jgi:hypothetical protein
MKVLVPDVLVVLSRWSRRPCDVGRGWLAQREPAGIRGVAGFARLLKVSMDVMWRVPGSHRGFGPLLYPRDATPELPREAGAPGSSTSKNGSLNRTRTSRGHLSDVTQTVSMPRAQSRGEPARTRRTEHGLSEIHGA